MNKKSFILISGLILLLSLASSVFAAGTPLDMVFIPSGYSMMGAEYGDLYAGSNAKPYHLVYLDALLYHQGYNKLKESLVDAHYPLPIFRAYNACLVFKERF